jgi:hypothetical protein
MITAKDMKEMAEAASRQANEKPWAASSLQSTASFWNAAAKIQAEKESGTPNREAN